MNCKCKYPNNELEPRMVCPKCGESEDGIRCEDCAYVASFRARAKELEGVLKYAVNNFDLPREDYSGLEWDAIQKIKQALKGGE